MNLYDESNKGTYKSSGRAFNKSFRPFITKFAKLVEDSMIDDKITEYVNANSKWQEFRKIELKGLKDQETVNLGGGSKRNEETNSEPEEEPEKVETTPEETGENEHVEEEQTEKVLLQDMPESDIEETLVEPKVSIEFVSNRYWTHDIANNIEALEADYE